jgi:hypothetical protein
MEPGLEWWLAELYICRGKWTVGLEEPAGSSCQQFNLGGAENS